MTINKGEIRELQKQLTEIDGEYQRFKTDNNRMKGNLGQMQETFEKIQVADQQ